MLHEPQDQMEGMGPLSKRMDPFRSKKIKGQVIVILLIIVTMNIATAVVTDFLIQIDSYVVLLP